MKKKWIAAGGGVAVILMGMILASSLRGSSSEVHLVYATAERGPLVVDILEAASVEASDAQIIKSLVEGQTTIISIVPEGTIITDEDVKAGKVLIELDSSSLRERLTQQEITVQSELASYTDAKESYEIQLNENESNLKAGELKVKFALMDLQKYLGDKAAQAFVTSEVALEDLIHSDLLGGDALLEKQTRENNIALASEDVKRAQVKLGWTEKLLAKGYKTRDEFEADQLSLKRLMVDLDKRRAELDLFVRYEFPKQAEKLRSDYAEAERELERIKARNRAQLSKAEARLKSNEATYKQQLERLEKIKEQIANCTIRATRPGMVVYAGSENTWRSDAEIAEGATVRERQELIKIPNASTMIAKARIHESVITRVRPGLKAEITIDALPGQKFTGEVQKVALLPDAQNRWMNPNLKVYTTEVLIHGDNHGLKPGMSAQVRIIVNELKDVVKVPIQAVTALGDQHLVFVDSGGQPVKREIQVGDYNDKFMQVVSGLKPGERVVMNPAPLLDAIRPKTAPSKGRPGEEPPAAEPAVAQESAPTAGAPPADAARPQQSVPGGGVGAAGEMNRPAAGADGQSRRFRPGGEAGAGAPTGEASQHRGERFSRDGQPRQRPSGPPSNAAGSSAP